MTSEEKRQFTARISQANKSELVVILFEMFDYCIEQAEDGFKTEDLQKADSYLKSAKGCVSELRGSLYFLKVQTVMKWIRTEDIMYLVNA